MTTNTPAASPTDSADAPAAAKPSARRFFPLVILAVVVSAYVGYRVYLAARPYQWSGTVEARTISVGSRTGGRIKNVLVHEGEILKEGQAILELEPGDLEAQKLMAQAALDQAQANLGKVQRGSRPEEIQEAKAHAQTAVAALQEQRAGARHEQVEAAEARLVAAEVTADKAKLDADRTHKLFAGGASTQAEVDNAEAAEKGAVAQRDAAKHALEELKNGARREDIDQAAARASEAQASAKLVEAGSRVEDIEVAAAQVKAAQGKLDQVLVMIGELTVRAPRASRVESFDLRPGDILGPNVAAATLLEEDELYVRIYVPETVIGRVRIGQEVPVSVDSFPKRTFAGVVEHISVVGEYSPRNLQTADERADQVFAARIGLREGKDLLRAGMAAFIEVPSSYDPSTGSPGPAAPSPIATSSAAPRGSQ